MATAREEAILIRSLAIESCHKRQGTCTLPTTSPLWTRERPTIITWSTEKLSGCFVEEVWLSTKLIGVLNWGP